MAGTGTLLGKYREIIVAVGLFLLFDLTVLGLNIYTSLQVSSDAVSINLAGRQRMLSQRMTKSVLELDADARAGTSLSAAQQELQLSLQLFDSTLRGFRQGGAVTGGAGDQAQLKAVDSASGRALLQQAEQIWQPLMPLLQPLASGQPSPMQIGQAAQQLRAHNATLLELMNDLTSSLEQDARNRARMLWLAQGVAVVLALSNFALIVFRFVRRLRDNDRQIEAAKQETDEILSTVQEGLFLLDSQYLIGNQVSASLPKVMGRRIASGMNFLDLLQNMVPQREFEAARDYLELLFGDRVKEALVRELNPLATVEVRDIDARYGVKARYLSLQFSRVTGAEGGKPTHLLVTVQDISEVEQLRVDLQQAKQNARAEVEVLLDLLKLNPQTLAGFINQARSSLHEINRLLRDVSGDYRPLIDKVFRQVHALKGDAAAIRFHLFEQLAHDFEDNLQALREKGEINGDDLLSLLPQLEECFSRIQQVEDMSNRMGAAPMAQRQPQDEISEWLESLQQLAARIAKGQNKKVALHTKLESLPQLPESSRVLLRELTIQLLRNAVTHGIEPMEERLLHAKPDTGHVRIELRQLGAGQFEFEVSDDGRGIVPAHIRSELERSGRYSSAALAAMDDREVVMKIFEPGFSTASSAGIDAGRGVGMDLVKERVSRLGGQLKLASRPNEFTSFALRFAAPGGEA
ncbi:MAG: two-component system, chemotaxis family, sensor kinase CheA [Pseudomonadota bacterium]|nr:two-component system, chemotaxis family, sensor kinase CheA [Pseudomonadota bacterium]